MTQELISNLNVRTQQTLSTPQIIKQEIPVAEKAMTTIINGRKSIEDILNREDKRLLVVVGPCSIHDTKAAMDYAEKLKGLSNEVAESMMLVMRVYFEKPRTTVGWKGLINDPHMDESFDIEEGLRIARKLLLEINEMGLPAGTEALDPISPQYLGDLISWSAIGARTTESQTHREMASALSSPVGFKNGTDGGLAVAINALHSVSNPHSFLGINGDGQVAITHTSGNGYGHIVLRGGSNGPNYDSVSISLVEKELNQAKLPSNIIVDCSHANSNKDHNLQPLVFNDCISQVVDGNQSIIGMMLESNIGPGNQKLTEDLSQMQYGVSITDACVDWSTTEKTLLDANEKLRSVLTKR
ncbi:MAG: 3-deoxy-7-phosphoheptulonate synthase [Betaproteobacteria bacterium]|jgi:3-deoxy-7-phosphoheptulonate synthase|nr:3-deoxy-7-phosphoheptulonate synthase [Betaproteobacteria bacterium]MDA9295959.1 3-deoxy-7-phosphoheptulonate synthase [Burkholderiales bacterium]MBT6530429.1 3-deoxy-7-phosphoheptulonate synthase [Betaproteobacteria bacterium]MBT7428051.1 3-deoxy-7-phosphoheptulonate synthase [Betaproteobacteria bacterium]MBT7998290.1 3-deoxy-7-phosphoheptulonate synthase [Betaproteobacteria bacterium]